MQRFTEEQIDQIEESAYNIEAIIEVLLCFTIEKETRGSGMMAVYTLVQYMSTEIKKITETF